MLWPLYYCYWCYAWARATAITNRPAQRKTNGRSMREINDSSVLWRFTIIYWENVKAASKRSKRFVQLTNRHRRNSPTHTYIHPQPLIQVRFFAVMELFVFVQRVANTWQLIITYYLLYFKLISFPSKLYNLKRATNNIYVKLSIYNTGCPFLDR